MHKLAFTALTVAAALSSTAAFANGAAAQTTVNDYACITAEPDEDGDVVSRCGDYDGVLHTTDLPTGGHVGIFNGDREEVIYVNDEPMSEQYQSGHLVLVDSDGDGDWEVDRNDTCRTFVGPRGNLVSIDATIMFVDGELIMRDIERVDSCE